jgi:hypothetical protein
MHEARAFNSRHYPRHARKDDPGPQETLELTESMVFRHGVSLTRGRVPR